MMSFDKYKRRRQHLNGHQRITYQKGKVNSYPKAYPKYSFPEFSPNDSMTSSVDKNKMKMMMTMMI